MQAVLALPPNAVCHEKKLLVPILESLRYNPAGHKTQFHQISIKIYMYFLIFEDDDDNNNDDDDDLVFYVSFNISTTVLSTTFRK